MSKDYRFPENFLWGTATSAHQIEGSPTADGAGRSIWHRFSHTPGNTWLDQTGDVACDHYRRYKDDVALMGELGTDEPTMLGRLLNDTRSAVIWGRYANAVFAAADAGSRLAQTVITSGGAALASLVGVLIKRGADGTSVVAGGGVIVEQPRLMAAFTAAMKAISPGSAVVLLREPPVMGALALAERALPAGATLEARNHR